MTSPELVLASASPRRRELLTQAGISFRVEPSDIDETLKPGLSPEGQVTRLALAKGAEVAGRPGGSRAVIGADTLVVLQGVILAKPGGAVEAGQMLRALRGRDHEVMTGVAVCVGSRTLSTCQKTGVRMRDYGDAEIERYVLSGEPLDKAGGYAIQDPEFHPVERIDGCYCNVVGLPLAKVLEMLRELGLTLAAVRPAQCEGCADWRGS